MSGASRGYLSVAAGSRRYLEMAVDMALSLREHTAHPIALAADAVLADFAEAHYRDAFDVIRRLDERFLGGRAIKYGAAAASPFEETVFIDADCIALAPLDSVYDSLEHSDMAMLGELLTLDDDENHHGFSTRALMRRFDLDHYLKTNSGLFCFRRSAALDIMQECLDCHLNEVKPQLRWSLLAGRWLGDEIAFGVVGGRRRLGTLPKPAQMYWPQEFATIDPSAPTKPLLHMLWPLPAQTFDLLTEATISRRERAGLRGDGKAHWEHEQRKLGRMARRRRVLKRLKAW